MSVTSISSFAAPDINSWQALRQRQQDFQALGNSLQSGDLSGAQQAYSDLQTLASRAPSTGSAANPIQQDFTALGQDLGSGNLTQAQQDYAQLKKDFQSAFQQNGGFHLHHHHGAFQPQTATTALNSAGSTALSQYSGSKVGSIASSVLSLVL